MLKDPDYVIYVPTHKKILKDIKQRDEQTHNDTTTAMEKLNKILGNIDD